MQESVTLKAGPPKSMYDHIVAPAVRSRISVESHTKREPVRNK